MQPRGRMKPLTKEQVATIGNLLSASSDWRSLAMFRIAIDTMLRASDLVALKIVDVTGHDGRALTETNIRQHKTKGGVISALSPKTIEALEIWLKERADMASWEGWLWPGRFSGHLTASQYRREVKRWIRMARLDTRFYSTHSLRRTKAAEIYATTGNVEAVRRLLGHSSVQATSAYLGVEDADALEIARKIII